MTVTRRILGVAILGLSLSRVALAAAPATPHTDPACWKEPRMYHAGIPSAALRQQVGLERSTQSRPETVGQPSPNGAYVLWVQNPTTIQRPPWVAEILMFTERSYLLRLTLHNLSQPVQPRWINEKLVSLRVAWGRIVFTDIIIDVEAEKLLYEEAVYAGDLMFHQYQQSCSGQCPCQPDSEHQLTP